jgi:hypothetical protein
VGESLCNVVFFELPRRGDAEALAKAVHLHWRGRAWKRRDHWVVSAGFRGGGDDLAALLRRTEEWVAETGLGAIRFELDDRSYVLRAGEVRWVALAA